uniref:Uncharacterized protein n=1 Tax=Glossina brevipalpis TaxID=37001 RepID=A0A1A9W133_9MUSC
MLNVTVFSSSLYDTSDSGLVTRCAPAPPLVPLCSSSPIPLTPAPPPQFPLPPFVKWLAPRERAFLRFGATTGVTGFK